MFLYDILIKYIVLYCIILIVKLDCATLYIYEGTLRTTLRIVTSKAP